MLALKALLGAAVVLLIQFLSQSRNAYIAGLVPLFPTFALIAHVIVGTSRPMDDLRATILFGAWSVVPYLCYLLSLYWLLDRMSLTWALISALLCWCLAAGILILAWSRF